MFLMYDSVTLDQVPNAPHAVAAYVNGKYANVDEARRRFPHARVLTISVEGDVAADCYDIERGDYAPEHAAQLFQIAAKAEIWRPCFYADLTTMPAVKQSLGEVTLDRHAVRLWVAYWNGHPDIPHGYDAHQFTNQALGRNLDESICRDDFFKPSHPSPDRTYRAEVALDADDGHWTITPIPFGEVHE